MPKKQFFFISLPLILWLILIISIGSFPGEKVPEVHLWQWDKLAHCGEYCILAILLIRYLYRVRNFSLIQVFISGFLISVVYAGIDELHQLFIPGRSCTWQDFIADSLGIGIGVYIMVVRLKNETR